MSPLNMLVKWVTIGGNQGLILGRIGIQLVGTSYSWSSPPFLFISDSTSSIIELWVSSVQSFF